MNGVSPDQKLDTIIGLLEQRDVLTIEYVSQIEIECPYCHLREWVRLENHEAKAADLAQMMRFLVEHGVRHSAFASAAGVTLHEPFVIVHFDKSQP